MKTMGVVEVVETSYEGLDAEAVVQYFETFLTPSQYEKMLRSLIFEVASNLREQGAVAEAMAYDAMFRNFCGGTNSLDKPTIYNLWLRAGYQPTYEDLRNKVERWK